MKKYILTALVLVLTACGSGDKQKEVIITNDSCLKKGESYLLTFTEVTVDGDYNPNSCGELGTSVVNTDPSGMMTAEGDCKINNRVDPKNSCVVFDDFDCNLAHGVKAHYEGKITFEKDGSGGAGLLAVNADSPDGSWCRSTYKITYDLIN